MPAYEARQGRVYCGRQCYESTRKNKPLTADTTTWTCTRCTQVKPLDAFGFRSQTQRPLSWCKVCTNEYAAEWLSKRPEKRREYTRRSRFALEPADYDALLSKQSGACATCRTMLEPGRKTHIDHCHNGGGVRGLLCSNCNMALGLVHDQPDTLRRMIDYVSAG